MKILGLILAALVALATVPAFAGGASLPPQHPRHVPGLPHR